MKDKKNIALIGMPAVGKSTVGVLLAKKMGFDFMDTDILIQAKEDQTLAQIIARKGWSNFWKPKSGIFWISSVPVM